MAGTSDDRDDQAQEKRSTSEMMEDLQREKLAIEISELRRPWWKKPSSYFAGLPTLLATAGLTIGFLNGYFSSERSKLELKRERLEFDVALFSVKKDSLNESILSSEKRMVALTSEIERLSGQAEALKDSLLGERQLKNQIVDAWEQQGLRLQMMQDSLSSLAQYRKAMDSTTGVLAKSAQQLVARNANLIEQLEYVEVSDRIRGLPSVYMAVAQHMGREGKESVYFRGQRLGTKPGVVTLIDLSPKTASGSKAIYRTDPSLRIEWSDTLVVIHQSDLATSIFDALRSCSDATSCSLALLVLTSDGKLSNMCKFTFRRE